MIATEFTRIDWPSLDAVVASITLAFVAKHAFGPTLVKQPLKAGIVGGEVSLKVSGTILLHRSHVLFVRDSNLAQIVTCVKGNITFLKGGLGGFGLRLMW